MVDALSFEDVMLDQADLVTNHVKTWTAVYVEVTTRYNYDPQQVHDWIEEYCAEEELN